MTFLQKKKEKKNGKKFGFRWDRIREEPAGIVEEENNIHHIHTYMLGTLRV